MAEEKKLYIEGRLHRPTGQDRYVADIIDIEGFTGTSDAVKTAIFEALKNKLQGANGINIDANDSNKTITISCGTISRELQSISWQGMSLSPTSIESGDTASLTFGQVIGHYSDNTTGNIDNPTVSFVFPDIISSINKSNDIYIVTAREGITSNQTGSIYIKYQGLTSPETLSVLVKPKPYVLWENMSIQPTEIVSGSTGLLTLGTVTHWNGSSFTDITNTAAYYYASQGSVEPENPRNGRTNIKIWAPTGITTNTNVILHTAYIDNYSGAALTGIQSLQYTVIPKKVKSISLMNDGMPKAIFANQNYSDLIYNYDDITGAITVKYNDNSSKNVYDWATISYTYSYSYMNITGVKVNRGTTPQNNPYEVLYIYPKNIVYTLTGNQTDPNNDIITLQSTITAQYTENGTTVSQNYPILIYPFHEAIIDTSYGYLHSGKSITSNIQVFDNPTWTSAYSKIKSSYSYSYSGEHISGLGLESTRYIANIVYGTSGTISLGVANDNLSSADSFKIVNTNIIPKDKDNKYIYSYSYTVSDNTYIFNLNALIQAPGPANGSPYLHVSFHNDGTPGGNEPGGDTPETPTYYWYAGTTLPTANNLAQIMTSSTSAKPTTWTNDPQSISITNNTGELAYFYYCFPTDWNVVIYSSDKVTVMSLADVSTFTLSGINYIVKRMGRQQAIGATQNLYAKC